MTTKGNVVSQHMSIATGSTRSLALFAAACCLAAMGFASAAPAQAAQPVVTVSKRASTLPGPRYAWVDSPQVLDAEADGRVQDDQFRARLQQALDKALQAKGYRPAAAGTRPDFKVAYRVGVRDLEQTTMHQEYAPETPRGAVVCGQDGCSHLVTTDGDGGVVTRMETQQFTEGGLMIEVIEPDTIRVLWRALNRGTVKPGKVTQQRLEAVTSETLAQLPAAGKTP